MLGVDFALENGAYRIKRIIDGAPWDSEVRSPLARPGVDVREGDYLLAVNGVPLDVSKDPWASFQGLAGKTVALTVNSRPTMEGARTVLVETLTSEYRLRNLAWIEANRRRVFEATGGRVGYIYVPDTGVNGQNELVRRVIRSGENHGESYWELPLVEEYKESLKTPYADVNNIAAGGLAGAITAGLFLREFIPSGVAWAHLDIAGPMFKDKDWKYYEAGAIGFGVKTLVDLCERFREPLA